MYTYAYSKIKKDGRILLTIRRRLLYCSIRLLFTLQKKKMHVEFELDTFVGGRQFGAGFGKTAWPSKTILN